MQCLVVQVQKIPEAVSAIYNLLEPFEEDERTKIVGAALLLLGQPMPQGQPASRTAPGARTEHSPEDASTADLPVKAVRWLRQHSITMEMLENWFHLEADPPEVVGTVPGRSDREKTANCYLLTGIAALLKTGEPTFDDSPARALCEHTGCYDANNHSKYIKFENKVAGDKKRGWKLLGPGLKEAGDLIKDNPDGAAG